MKLPFFIPPPDARSESEIESDIADEIAFHLFESAREFQDAGETTEAATALAEQRFGNIKEYKKQLKRIALKERIMLQRINMALMIIVILIVGVVSIQVFTTQRYNTLALQAITAELANMKTSAQTTAKMGHVIVEGDLDKPGRYAFSIQENETLNDLLTKLGVEPGKSVMYQNVNYSVDSLLKKGGMQILLRDGETAKIYDNGGGYTNSALAKLPGKWQQIDEDGKVIQDGITLNISDPNDFMNLSGSTIGRIEDQIILSKSSQIISGYEPNAIILKFSGTADQGEVRMALQNEKSTSNISIQQNDGMPVGIGKWKLEDGHLYLNLGKISPKPGEPLIFEKVK